MKSSILTDLIYTAVPIENRINDILSSATQEEFDINQTTDRLIDEALLILIDLLKDNGIEFHTEFEDIKSDRYNISFIIFLYKFFNTIDVIYRIKTTSGYLKNLTTGLIDTPNSEILTTMISILKDTTRLNYHQDFHNYIYDKVTNTEKYAQYIINMIDVLNNQEDDKDITFDDDEKAFIEKLVEQKRWIQICISDLIYKGAIPINVDVCNNLTNLFCKNYSLPENVKILSKYKDLSEANPEFFNHFFNKIKTNSELHIEYYMNSDLGKLSLCQIIGIICMQVIDHELFDIMPNYKRLIKFAPDDIPIKNIINIIHNHSSKGINHE
jgi:hypothetical protein